MIIVIDFGSLKSPEIVSVVDEHMDCTLVHWEEFKIETLPTECVGIILSGAPILITEINLSLYIDPFNWLKNSPVPVLGICFGHQLIGLVHGAFGHLQREDRDWQTIEVLIENELFQRLPSEVEMMEDHCEVISIPPNFELIATSDASINEGMRHVSKPLYGVQFHPEVSGNMGAQLIGNFVSICTKQTQNT